MINAIVETHIENGELEKRLTLGRSFWQGVMKVKGVKWSLKACIELPLKSMLEG